MEQPQRARPRHRLLQLRVRQASLPASARPQPAPADLQRPQRLLQRLLEIAPDRHRLAHRLHLRRQRVVRSLELLEREPRRLHHDVVQRRLEAGRRRARDVVGQLVERVAHRQLRRDLRDRENRRLRGQRRAAAHARIHLDHHQAAVLRVHRELHVRPARLHADHAHHRQARVAHDLVFAVRQRLRRRHRDAVARVHAHRIEVLDGAHDARVVLAVAHHLHLEFLPPQHRFLDQHFAHRAQRQPVRADRLELRLAMRANASRPRRPS
jgi:hypothetical protein